MKEKKRKEFIKIRISGKKNKKKLYRHPTEFRTKKQTKKAIKDLKNIHTPWGHKVYYRVIPEKNKWNEEIFTIYLHTTEPNFMAGFRGSR